MTSTPSSPKLPEPLKVVAWRTHLSGAEWRVADYVLPDGEPLVKLSDAQASIQALEAEVAGLREDAGRQREEDREILAAVVRELGEGSDGNAPGHAHSLPGIWDWDNGKKAGKACSWCLCWTKFTELAARAAQEARGDLAASIGRSSDRGNGE